MSVVSPCDPTGRSRWDRTIRAVRTVRTVAHRPFTTVTRLQHRNGNGGHGYPDDGRGWAEGRSAPRVDMRLSTAGFPQPVKRWTSAIRAGGNLTAGPVSGRRHMHHGSAPGRPLPV